MNSSVPADEPIIQLLAIVLANWKVVSSIVAGLVLVCLSDAYTKWELFKLKKDFANYQKTNGKNHSNTDDKVTRVDGDVRVLENKVTGIGTDVKHVKEQTTEKLSKLELSLDRFIKMMFNSKN